MQRDVTRREFVKTSSAVGLTALTATRWAHGYSSLDTVRVGLIGCGGRGSGAIAQALRADKNTRLAALGDAFQDKIDYCLGNLEKDDALAEKIDVTTADQFTDYDCYQRVIDNCDVVLMATPPVFRPIHLKYAVEAGKHVFCEKPIAVDAPGVRSVLETVRQAKKQNTALMSGFCWRHSYPQRAFYGAIRDGRLGDVVSMHTTYNTGPLGDVARKEGWSDAYWQLRNWKAFIHLSGDHIVEQAIHAIDWIQWAMDDVPTSCTAVGGRQCRAGEWTGNLYDHFGVVYEFASGARAFHMCRQIPDCSGDNTAYVMGTKGTGYSNPWTPTSIRIDGEVEWRYGRGPTNDMYQTEHDELFASIRNGEPFNDGMNMCNSTLMAIMGRQAAYTGETLSWEQMMNSQEDLTPKTWGWGHAPFPAVPMPSEKKFS